MVSVVCEVSTAVAQVVVVVLEVPHSVVVVCSVSQYDVYPVVVDLVVL
jgi:hypothetical protein